MRKIYIALRRTPSVIVVRSEVYLPIKRIAAAAAMRKTTAAPMRMSFFSSFFTAVHPDPTHQPLSKYSIFRAFFQREASLPRTVGTFLPQYNRRAEHYFKKGLIFEERCGIISKVEL